MIAGEFGTLKIERGGPVLTVRIDNPPRNLYDASICADLESLLDALARDRTVRAVVFTGAPEETFVTRYDTTEMLRDSQALVWPMSVRQARTALGVIRVCRRIPGLQRLLLRSPMRGMVNLLRHNANFERMSGMDTAFIAAINGMAVGGGLLLPLACDLRLAAEEGGPLGLPEAGIGLVAATGATHRLARTIGSGRALELLLRGHQITPQDGLELGLVHEVVPRDELLSAAQARAAELAQLPPGIVGIVKRLVHGAYARRPEAGDLLEGASMVATLSRSTTRDVLTEWTRQVHRAGEVDRDQIDAYEAAQHGQLSSLGH